MKRKTKFHLLLSTIPIVFTLPFFISANSNNENEKTVSDGFTYYNKKIELNFSDSTNIEIENLKTTISSFNSKEAKILSNFKNKLKSSIKSFSDEHFLSMWEQMGLNKIYPGHFIYSPKFENLKLENTVNGKILTFDFEYKLTDENVQPESWKVKIQSSTTFQKPNYINQNNWQNFNFLNLNNINKEYYFSNERVFSSVIQDAFNKKSSTLAINELKKYNLDEFEEILFSDIYNVRLIDSYLTISDLRIYDYSKTNDFISFKYEVNLYYSNWNSFKKKAYNNSEDYSYLTENKEWKNQLPKLSYNEINKENYLIKSELKFNDGYDRDEYLKRIKSLNKSFEFLKFPQYITNSGLAMLWTSLFYNKSAQTNWTEKISKISSDDRILEFNINNIIESEEEIPYQSSIDKGYYDRPPIINYLLNFDLNFVVLNGVQLKQHNNLIKTLNELKQNLVKTNLITKDGYILYNSETNFANPFDKTINGGSKSNYENVLKKQEEIKEFIKNTNNLNIKATFKNDEKNNTSILNFDYFDIFNNNKSITVFKDINYKKINEQIEISLAQRLKFKPSAYIDKKSNLDFKLVNNEVPEIVEWTFFKGDTKQKEQIEKYYNFPSLELYSPKENNEILYINNQPVPIFNNVYTYQFKDKLNEPSTNYLLEQIKELEKRWKASSNENERQKNQLEYEKALNKYQNINVYLIEVKQFDKTSQNKDKLKTIFSKKIMIQSQKDVLFNIKFFAWNPKNNKEQKEMIEQFLTDPKGNYILDENKNKIPNPKYNPFINSETGTNMEYIVLSEKFQEKEAKWKYNHNNQFILFNLLNEKGEKNQSPTESETTNIYEAHVVYGGIKLELGNGVNRFDVWKWDGSNREWQKQDFYSQNIDFYKNSENIIGDAGLFKIVANKENGQAKHKIVYIKKNVGKEEKVNDEFFSKAVKENIKEFENKITPLWEHYWGKQLLIFLKLTYNISENIAKTFNYDEILNYWKEFYNFSNNELTLKEITPIINEAEIKNFMEYNVNPKDDEKLKENYKKQLMNFVSFPYFEYINTEIIFENIAETNNSSSAENQPTNNQSTNTESTSITKNSGNSSTDKKLADVEKAGTTQTNDNSSTKEQSIDNQPINRDITISKNDENSFIDNNLMDFYLNELKKSENWSDEQIEKFKKDLQSDELISQLSNIRFSPGEPVSYVIKSLDKEENKNIESNKTNILNTNTESKKANSKITDNTNDDSSNQNKNTKLSKENDENISQESGEYKGKIIFKFTTSTNFIKLTKNEITVYGNWMKLDNGESGNGGNGNKKDLFMPKIETKLINDFYWENNENITVDDLNTHKNNFFDTTTYENLEAHNLIITKYDTNENENKKAKLTFNFNRKITSNLQFQDKEYVVHLELVKDSNRNPFDVSINESQIKETDFAKMDIKDISFVGINIKKTLSDKIYENLQKQFEKYFGNNKITNLIEIEKFDDILNALLKPLSSNTEKITIKPKIDRLSNGKKFKGKITINVTNDMTDVKDSPDYKEEQDKKFQESKEKEKKEKIKEDEILETDFSKMKFQTIALKDIIIPEILKEEIFNNLSEQTKKYFGNNKANLLIQIQNEDAVLKPLLKPKTLNSIEATLIPKMEELSDGRKFKGSAKVTIINDLTNVGESPFYKEEYGNASNNKNDELGAEEKRKLALKSLNNLQKTSNIISIVGVSLVVLIFSSYSGYVLYIRQRKII
ncbi:hypothetical protein [Mesomycoplasma lagogenitalium]|uniref:Uncharacterized protein n=1 Tax=Mesomycoplasma lagogenitalium TaxID=171286 RepID=A0ABY8LTE7_9BACT|nr:hypothetical protein [Mesomycoplasma lagogenitalium]WGI36519.1 hypothetical protein QEG99_03575 [Mesomycoplasma lagogenitalium]